MTSSHNSDFFLAILRNKVGNVRYKLAIVEIKSHNYYFIIYIYKKTELLDVNSELREQMSNI